MEAITSKLAWRFMTLDVCLVYVLCSGEYIRLAP